MAKSYEELAADITIAWIQAHQPNGETLVALDNAISKEKVAEFYQHVYRAILSAVREGPPQVGLGKLQTPW